MQEGDFHLPALYFRELTCNLLKIQGKPQDKFKKRLGYLDCGVKTTPTRS